MIRVQTSLQGNGCLKLLTARGHAFKTREGFSPACAAVTALLRTAGELLSREKGLDARVSAPEEGLLTIQVGDVPAYLVPRVQGITDFLLLGIGRVAEEVPQEVALILDSESFDC